MRGGVGGWGEVGSGEGWRGGVGGVEAWRGGGWRGGGGGWRGVEGWSFRMFKMLVTHFSRNMLNMCRQNSVSAKTMTFLSAEYVSVELC